MVMVAKLDFFGGREGRGWGGWAGGANFIKFCGKGPKMAQK